MNNERQKEKVTTEYKSFAFVRNPFDRLVSQFHFTGRWWWKKYPQLSHHEFSFKNYVKYVVDNNYSFSRHRYYSKCGRGPDKNWSMLQFVDDDVDFIGRFENLQEDFNITCDKIGIPRQKLPHKNKTKHKHYTEFYDDETREIVAEKYAEDIEYFGYNFEKYK